MFSDSGVGSSCVAEPLNNVEPSPFTVSNHPLLSDLEVDSNQLVPLSSISQSEQVWQDGLTVNPESTLSASEQQHQHFNVDCSASDLVSAWDFGNPGRFVKKKKRNAKSKEHQKRYNSKVPFHKKVETLDDLAWHLDHSMMLGADGGHGVHANGTLNSSRGPASNNPNDSTKSSCRDGNPPSLVSPGPHSAGPVTPLGISTPKAPGPPSIGPPTPMDVDSKQPSTPKSVPPSSPPVPSPFPEKKVPLPLGSGGQPSGGSASQGSSSSGSENQNNSSVVKSENSNGVPGGAPNQPTTQQVPNVSTYFGPKAEAAAEDDVAAVATLTALSCKRPALPSKEYERELKTDDKLTDNIFDKESLKSWLNYPVKRVKLSDPKSNNDPLRPLYRRPSQLDGLTKNDFRADSIESVKVKSEPDSNGKVNSFGDPRRGWASDSCPHSV